MTEASKSRLSSVEVRKQPDGSWLGGVVAKRTYRIVGGHCRLDDAQVPLVEEPDMDARGILDHDSDRILSRDLVDVVVLGHARSLRPRAVFDVVVRVGAAVHRIRTFGDRRLVIRSDGQLQFSDPEPTTAIPLRWEHAYGGVDRTLLDKYGDPLSEFAASVGETLDPEQSLFAYPRNPHGCGYLVEATHESVAATLLPNFEHVHSLLTPESIVRRDPELWPKAPIPAGTRWLPYVYFPRSCQVGLPTPLFSREHIRPEDFVEVALGQLRPDALAKGSSLTDRIDIGCAQGAAPGMRFAEVTPGSHVGLDNVHPRLENWQWRIADERPRMAFRLPPIGPVELAPRIRSVLIEPDEDRVCVVWVGEMRLAEPLTSEQMQRAEYGLRWISDA